MKYKNLLIITLLSLLLALGGCVESEDETRTGGISEDTFHGGEKALNMGFSDNAPPETIRDGGVQDFSVRLSLENVGETDIEEGEGYVSLSGFSSSDFNLNESYKELPSLRGVKKQGSGSITDGGRTQISFNDLTYEPNISSSSFDQEIYANVCYPYKTDVIASFCVSGDALSDYVEGESVCNTESQRTFGTSGAPVTVENVEQYPIDSDSIELKFDITHEPTENTGRLFKSGSISEGCKINGKSPTSSDASLEKDYVNYEVEASNLEDISCDSGESSGEVKLSDDSTTIHCTVNTQGQNEHTKPISIELSYDYVERISKEIEIESYS